MKTDIVRGSTIEDTHHRILHRSRNLRGLLDHARRSPVTHYRLTRGPQTEAMLRVLYADGLTGKAAFASFAVAARWVRQRVAFAGAEILP